MLQSKKDETSDRCLQTVKPLADKLCLEVKQPCKREEARQLVCRLLEDKDNELDGKIVLICWCGMCLRKRSGANDKGF